MEKVIETYKIENAIFELVEKPEAIYAGKFYYVKDYANKGAMFAELSELENNWNRLNPFNLVIEPKLPINDVGIAINFSLYHNEKIHGYGYGRETLTENQPENIDVFKMPVSFFVKAYINKHTFMLLTKQENPIDFDIVAELFSYIWHELMPTHGLKVAENGAKDIEIYDNMTTERKAVCIYAAAMRA